MALLQNRWIRGALLLVRIALGVLFIFAAWTKLREPWAVFAISVDSYQILPQWGVIAVARTLPWFELALGILLITGFLIRLSTTLTSAILLLFFTVLIRSYMQGLQIDCGCFGLGEKLSIATLVRDAVLLAASLLVTVTAFGVGKRHRNTLAA